MLKAVRAALAVWHFAMSRDDSFGILFRLFSSLSLSPSLLLSPGSYKYALIELIAVAHARFEVVLRPREFNGENARGEDRFLSFSLLARRARERLD